MADGSARWDRTRSEEPSRELSGGPVQALARHIGCFRKDSGVGPGRRARTSPPRTPYRDSVRGLREALDGAGGGHSGGPGASQLRGGRRRRVPPRRLLTPISSRRARPTQCPVHQARRPPDRRLHRTLSCPRPAVPMRMRFPPQSNDRGNRRTDGFGWPSGRAVCAGLEPDNALRPPARVAQ